LARHPAHHRWRKQFTTYVESLMIRSRPGNASTARITAVSSIRWFVVLAA
jgi:hypothetical protein